MIIDTRIVTPGDVIEIDDTWQVSVQDNLEWFKLGGQPQRPLIVGQRFKDVAENPGRGAEWVVTEGPEFPAIQTEELRLVADLNEVSIRGKRFLVVATTMAGFTEASDPSRLSPALLKESFQNKVRGYRVTARELGPDHVVKEGGKTIQFFQTGDFAGNVMAPQPQVVGRMEPQFGAFELAEA